MDEQNPFHTPGSDLESDPGGADKGPFLPWEDPARSEGVFGRLRATAVLLLTRPDEAGEALGARKTLGRAIGFFALAGLPFQWFGAALAQWVGLRHPEQQAALMELLHLPVPPEPTAQQAALQKTMVLVQVGAFPLVVALGTLLLGVLAHGGLWATRGLGRDRGLEVSYRSLLYTSGAVSWIQGLFAFGVFLPGRLFLLHQALALALGLGLFSYQGILLAKAHGTQTWRGVVGIFLPFALCCLCCACAGGGLAALGRGLRP